MMVQLNILGWTVSPAVHSYVSGGVYMAEMVRVNTRIGYDANAWLDAESERTGVPKSTLIHLAIEQYIQQKEVMGRMADIGELVQAIERMEKRLAVGGLQAE